MPSTSLIKSLVETHKFLQSLTLFKNVKSIISCSNSDPFAIPFLLKSCIKISHQNLGKCYHGFVLKSGFVASIDINTSLIHLYLKFGKNVNAYQLFEEMSTRDRKYFDFVIRGFGSARLFEETLVVFEEGIKSGFTPCLESVRQAIVACGELRILEKGRCVHDFVVHNGLVKSVYICNLLISMYVKMRELDLACCTFNAMEERDLVSWNTLITGYAQSGNWMKAFDIFLAKKECGDIIHNNVTLLGLAFACGQAGHLEQGMSVHGHCIRAGLLSDFRLGTAILDMYAKCGNIECAEMLFEEDMFEKSLVSWNSLISGYSKAAYYHRAVNFFNKVRMHSNFKPDPFTLANIIPAYSNVENIEGIRLIHALILKKGFNMGSDVVLGTAMIDAYGKCSDVASAEGLFYGIEEADTPTWNTMLTGYYLDNNADQGMQLFKKMLHRQISPDWITITLLLQMCGLLGSLKLGSMAHGYGLVKGFSSILMVENALLDMYIRCKSMENSEKLFALMNFTNTVTWNTMLSGYVKIASYSSTMKMFYQMQFESASSPDHLTIISVVRASAASLTTHGAVVAHAYILKLGFDSETMVMNSLIDAYAKNGFIASASSVFVHMGQIRDQWSWNVMIAGYGVNGQAEKACKLLYQMNGYGYEPDFITFTALLSSCAHSGMIDEGCKYFDLMVNKYKIQPTFEHWTCIINMFGRAGRLEEAYKLVISSQLHNVNPSDSAVIWGAFMDACRMYNNIELGEMAGKKLLQMSPQNSGYPILLSNLYASTMRWDEAMNVREVFMDGSLIKETGYSSVS
ncbi:hypothetical protein SOVF_186170, partial [Spinacia oleracea]